MPILLLVPNFTDKWPSDMFHGVTGASDVLEKIWTQCVAQFFLLYTATPRFSHLNKNPGFQPLQTSNSSLFRIDTVPGYRGSRRERGRGRVFLSGEHSHTQSRSAAGPERWREYGKLETCLWTRHFLSTWRWMELLCCRNMFLCHEVKLQGLHLLFTH
jgi:hypothetical protein